MGPARRAELVIYPLAGGLAGSLQVQARALWQAVRQRSILLPAAFVFLWQARRTSCFFCVVKCMKDFSQCIKDLVFLLEAGAYLVFCMPSRRLTKWQVHGMVNLGPGFTWQHCAYEVSTINCFAERMTICCCCYPLLCLCVGEDEETRWGSKIPHSACAGAEGHEQGLTDTRPGQHRAAGIFEFRVHATRTGSAERGDGHVLLSDARAGQHCAAGVGVQSPCHARRRRRSLRDGHDLLPDERGGQLRAGRVLINPK